MSRVLKCDPLMPGCDFEAKGTTDEILAAAGKHAAEDHGLEVTEDLVEKVKTAIQDE